MAIKVPVYMFVYLTNLVRKVIRDGRDLLWSISPGEVGGDGYLEESLESWHGNTCKVATTSLWIMSWVTGEWTKMLSALSEVLETDIFFFKKE